jgi:hypothetical protein
MSSPPRYRRDPYSEKKGRANVVRWLARLVLLFIGLTSCLTASFILYSRWREAQVGGRILLEGGSASLNPVERLYLQTYLVNNVAALESPASQATTPVRFVVSVFATTGWTTSLKLANTPSPHPLPFLN